MYRKEEMGFREFQKAVNEAALIKSAFYTEARKEIREAIARYKPKLDAEDKPIFEDGEPIMIENSTDDMIAAIFSIGMRGSKVGAVSDRYISRIENGAYYSRVLEQYMDTTNFARHLKEKTRIDVAIVIKNILPDMTRVQTPIYPKHDSLQDYAGDGRPPQGAQPLSYLTQEQLDKQRG